MAAKDLLIHPQQAPRLGSYQGIPIREDIAYTNHKGEESPKTRKQAEEVLDRLQEPLRKVLEPEEAVFCIVVGQAPVSAFEQLALGWYIYQATGTWLIFTNRRLLAFRIKPKGLRGWAWARGLRCVQWGDVAEAKAKGWLSATLPLKYRHAKKDTYWGIRATRRSGFAGGVTRKLKALLQPLLTESTGETTSAPGIVPLCPDCTAALTPGVYQCSRCGLAFKDEKTLVRRSLLIPGGGYFYTGMHFLGVGDFLVEAYLVVLLIAMAFVAISPPAPQPGEAPVEPVAYWITTGIVAAILAIEKWGTIHHCRRFIREFLPVK